MSLEFEEQDGKDRKWERERRLKKKLKKALLIQIFQVENRHFQILTMLYSTEQAPK